MEGVPGITVWWDDATDTLVMDLGSLNLPEAERKAFESMIPDYIEIFGDD
jgi:hypothetical protein